jgi:hypothetical protein
MQKKIRTNNITTVLLAVALLMLAAPAMADEPASSFVISGWVSTADDNPCNNPWVQITNLNSSKGWDAENNSSSNYYQLVLDSSNVSADDVLQIDASGCSQSNITEHTVTQVEIDGGGFELNITLEPIIISCDSSGAEKNEFAPGETVHVKGSGLSASTNYTLWIQNDPVSDGDALAAGEDPLGSRKGVTTDEGGNLATPVPELASIILFAVGLVMLIGLVRFRRGK